ncbi:MAG: NAD-dependent succinate-semialdehyde dehydrogenase [Phycisphaerae bacterium]|nr:NAD-dependent succinate-semialdehyde dehydrogenase [Tepidisphaeraceae bacterium]
MLHRINPATEMPLEPVAEHSDEEVEAILRRAADAFAGWRRVPIGERAAVMRRAGAVLRERSADLCAVMAREMGKPVTAGAQEVEKCAGACEFFADHAAEMLANDVIATDAARSYVRYDPLGAVLAIMPWNFPLWQVVRFAAPALMAGNVGVLKHAPNVPECARAIEEVFAAAGFPPGVFAAVLVGNDRAAGLIRHEAIRAVTLTGSERAGMAVASEAGKVLKKTVLELGGSDPFIVIPPEGPGADEFLRRVAKHAAAARCINAGQSCIAAKRFIVSTPFESERRNIGVFERALVEAMTALRVGDPTDPATEVGPLARLDLLEHLHDQVQRSVDGEWTRVLTGGHRLDRPGYFYAPTVISGSFRSAAWTEETFGPVAAVTGVDGGPYEDSAWAAVAFANDTSYGLGASIWTDDVALAERLAGEIEAGCVFVNGIVKSDVRLPFGGVKNSGYGRELSTAGIREFVNVKTVWMG